MSQFRHIEVKATGLDGDGVGLISPGAADFDSRLELLVPRSASLALKMKPYLAIVSNDSERTVVAWSVTFWLRFGSGESYSQSSQFKYPDAVAGAALRHRLHGREIRRGEQRVIGMGFELPPHEDGECYRDFHLSHLENWDEVASLHIELDAVVFDDGALRGPDHSDLAGHFAAYVAAKQDAYRRMVEGIDEAVSDDIFAPLREALAVRPDNIMDVSPGRYGREAAAETVNLAYKIIRDVFGQALRPEPFVIRR